jgi:hypothetical protein
MKRIFVAVYLLVLVTQLPHVAAAYASLERAGWYQLTAWAAAVAFEASIAAFTYRIVVERSRRRTTRWGLAFFLIASAVANASYYSLAPALFRWIMPGFATVALPLSLALFASEFGAETLRDERRTQRQERQAEPLPIAVQPFTCETCGRGFAVHNALNAHMRSHNGHERVGREVVA